MRCIIKALVLIFSITLLSGCADNVKRYKADPTINHQIQSNNFKPVELKSVTMVKGDENSIMCRMNSMISLPEKMKYSQYIADALEKSLVVINDKKSFNNSAHKLNVLLTKVDVNTLKAKWYIDADITIDNHQPIQLKTVSDHNFSYIAASACNNAASAFDEAVDNFIKKIFTHPQIVNYLK